MKKTLLVAMLVGMLLIGAASANMMSFGKPPSFGTAIANADAYAKGKATVDLNPWTDANIKEMWTQGGSNTWTFANAKLDPVSESVSNGWAISQIAGKLVENGWCQKQVINVDKMQAYSQSTAFNYAEGSNLASGATNTVNIANTFMSDDKISSLSIADSSSTGFANGLAGPAIMQPKPLPALPTLPA